MVQKSRRNAQWILVALMAVGGLAALLGAASQAIWTDTDPVAGNDFATGSVSLTTSPTSAIWTPVTAAAPGDISGTGSLTVTDNGTMQLRYAVTGSVTSATLAAGMNLRIGLRGGAGCDFPYHTSAGATTALVDDTQLFAGTLNTAVLIGSNAQGNQAGDRTLAASANEVLCFAVVLPLTAANTLQSLSNTTTFTFDSEQTANNP
ncbi:MAG: hypothetical protein Q8Q00_07230 [Dehalococcoidia bacterium]|nr:hypothetical protein [Dehalococcoidia bacterium]